MKRAERDLLILLAESRYSEVEIEREVVMLNRLLSTIETPDFIRPSIELIDINRHRIASMHFRVDRALRKKELEPFQFIFHKN